MHEAHVNKPCSTRSTYQCVNAIIYILQMVDYDEELSEIILYKCLEIGLGVLVWKYFNPVGNILTEVGIDKKIIISYVGHCR